LFFAKLKRQILSWKKGQIKKNAKTFPSENAQKKFKKEKLEVIDIHEKAFPS
jgi:hypothetical protein